jgi:hypothetical protein
MLSSGFRISSVAHQLSCLELSFHCAWLLGACFFASPLFPGQVQWSISWLLLSVCCDGLLIIFQFCSIIWLWVLLTGSGDELCGHYLPFFRQRLITHLLLALLPFQPLFTESLGKDQLLAPPLFSGALSVTLPFCCVLVFSNLFIVQFALLCFVLFCRGVTLPRGLCCLSQEYLGECHVTLGTQLFGLPNVSQAGLEPASGSVAALLFSQCNVAWRTYPWARGSGCQSFDSPCCLIPPSVV